METADIVLRSAAFYQSIKKSTLPRAITAHSPLVGRDLRRLIIITISSPPKKQLVTYYCPVLLLMVAHYYRTDRHVSQQMETSQTSFFLSSPKKKKKFPAAKKKKKCGERGIWNNITTTDKSQGSLGPQPEENQKPPPSGGRDGWKENAHIKKKAGRKRKQKSPSVFLLGCGERGVRSFGGSFSSFATLSLSLSVSPYRRPQKSPCRYANAPAGVAPALLIAPYSSFGSHACPYSVWCSKFAFNDTSGGTSKEETPWVSSKAKWRDEGKKRTQQQQQDNLLLCNVCV